MALTSSLPSFMFEKRHNLSIWYFERDFCQSRHGPNADTGTNSCTLIALLTADKIAKSRINTFVRDNAVPEEILNIFSKSMDDGNASYSRLMNARRLDNFNLSIPEAMEALQGSLSQIEEWFFVQINVPKDETYTFTASEKLHDMLETGLNLWKLRGFINKYVFVVLIAANRSILLCFEDLNNVITLLDSHHHSEEIGAIIAQSNFRDLESLARWIVKMFAHYYLLKPKIYELSFVVVKDGGGCA